MKKKTALITGASSGIGLAISEAFIKAGYNTFMHYHSNDSPVKALKDKYDKKGIESIHLVQAGLTKSTDLDQLLKTIESKNLTIDVLVNNAGIKIDNPTDIMTDKDFEQVLKTNVTGPFMLSKRIIPMMKSNRYGRIINISSGVAKHGAMNKANYGASKAAIENLTKSWAQELGPYGITVNTVAPGLIETPMTSEVDEETKQAYINKIPIKRLAKPEEVAHACLFFADEKSGAISQQLIGVNGGLR